jgi:hypothetical protein
VIKSRKIRFSKLGYECSDRLGLNNLYFQASLNWALQTPDKSNVDTLLSQYKITETLLDGGLNRIFAYNILIDTLKYGRTLTKEQIKKYSLMPFTSGKFGSSSGGSTLPAWQDKQIGENKKVDIYMDAPIGFGLAFNQIPVSLVSFGVTAPKELILVQIQGVKPIPINIQTEATGKRKYGTWPIEPLDWQAFLIDTSKELAKDAGFESIAIQSAKNNTWVNSLDEESQPRLSLESAKILYDDVAIRLGFKLGADENWHKSIVY